jgi:hypothetical protein
MGIFTEAHAESSARDYESILLAVIEECENDDFDDTYPRKLALFAKKHIYPKYQNELSEAWRDGVKEDQKKIEKFFKNLH